MARSGLALRRRHRRSRADGLGGPTSEAALPLSIHVSPGLVRGEAGAVVLRARSVCGGIIDPCASSSALPELDRGPLVEEAHGQGHPAPMLDGTRRCVRAMEHALGAPIVLVAGEGGAMDRELRNRESPAVVG